MSGEDDFTDRPQELRGAPDGYLRKSDVFKSISAIIGILGTFLGFWRVIDSLDESLRQEIRNERIERINSDNEIRLQLYQRRR